MRTKGDGFTVLTGYSAQRVANKIWEQAARLPLLERPAYIEGCIAYLVNVYVEIAGEIDGSEEYGDSLVRAVEQAPRCDRLAA